MKNDQRGDGSLDNPKYGSIYSMELAAKKIEAGLSEVLSTNPRMYGKTLKRYENLAHVLISCVDKIAKIAQIDALSPKSNDEFNELAEAAGFDLNLDSALEGVQQGLKEAKAFASPADSTSEKVYIDLKAVDSVFREMSRTDFGWNEVNHCAKLLYTWFHERFIQYPCKCKISCLGLWVHTFIIQFGNFCSKDARQSFEDSMLSWCDRLSKINMNYVHPYFIHQTLKSKEPSDFTLQAVLINDILYEICLYKLSDQFSIFDNREVSRIVKDKNPALTPKINLRFARRSQLIENVGFTESNEGGEVS